MSHIAVKLNKAKVMLSQLRIDLDKKDNRTFTYVYKLLIYTEYTLKCIQAFFPLTLAQGIIGCHEQNFK